MKRVAYISDTHEVSPDIDSQSIFPGYIRLQRSGRRQDVYDLIRTTIRDCNDVVLGSIRSSVPDLLVHLGDVMSGYKETGIAHPSVSGLAVDILEGYRRVSAETRICWGNHDVGYLGRSRTPDPESVLMCEELSPLFWSYDAEGVLVVGICSPLLEKNSLHIPEASDRASDQEDFLSDVLRSNKGRRWILCSHQPVKGRITKIIEPHRSALDREMCGHRHIPGTPCPSSAPISWRGGAWVDSVIYGDKAFFSNRECVYPFELSERVKEFPFSSLPKALFWMFVGQFYR